MGRSVTTDTSVTVTSEATQLVPVGGTDPNILLTGSDRWTTGEAAFLRTDYPVLSTDFPINTIAFETTVKTSNLPHSSIANDVAVSYKTGVFVIDEGSKDVAASFDFGDNWSLTNLGQLSGNCQEMVVVNNVLFIVSDATGKVAYTTDGITWNYVNVSIRQTSTDKWLHGRAIDYDNVSGKYLFMSPNDGISYTVVTDLAATIQSSFSFQTISSPASQEAIRVINDIFFTGEIQASRGLLMHSSDGKEWSYSPISSLDSSLLKYSSVAGKYVAVRGNDPETNCKVSTDLITWTDTPLGVADSIGWDKLEVTNAGTFILMDDGTNQIARSTDGGTTWTIVTVGTGSKTFLDNGTNQIIISSNVVRYSSDDGVSWNIATTGLTSLASGSTTVVNGIFYLYEAGTTTPASSADGITWNSAGSVAVGGKPVFLNGTYLVANNTNQAYTSSDLITWAANTVPISTIVDFRVLNGNFIVTKQSGTTTNLAHSTNGTSWTAESTNQIIAASTANNPISFIGSNYILFINNTGNVYTSTDLSTWTSTSSASTSTFGITRTISNSVGVVFQDVTPETNGGVSLSGTSDGTTYFDIARNINPNRAGVINNNIIVVGRQNSSAQMASIIYSTDGGITYKNKSLQNLSSGVNTGDEQKVFHLNDRFILSTQGGIAYSTDGGTTWNLETNPSTTLLQDNLKFSNGRYYGVNNAFTRLVTSIDGVTWSSFTGTGNPRNILDINGTLVSGNPNSSTTTYHYSTSGTSWTAGALPNTANDSTSQITVGNNYIFMESATTGNFMYSYDGIVWQNESITSASLRLLTFHSGIAIGFNGTSTNLVWAIDTDYTYIPTVSSGQLRLK